MVGSPSLGKSGDGVFILQRRGYREAMNLQQGLSTAASVETFVELLIIATAVALIARSRKIWLPYKVALVVGLSHMLGYARSGTRGVLGWCARSAKRNMRGTIARTASFNAGAAVKY